MAVEYLTVRELEEKIRAGAKYSLAQPLIFNGQLIIGTGKQLTLRDIERVRPYLPSQVPVVKFIGHFISDEKRLHLLRAVLKVLRESKRYAKLAPMKKDNITKILKNQILDNDYILWKLAQMYRYSKKLYIHSVHTCLTALIVEIAYQKKHSNGMVNSMQYGWVINAAFLHDVGLLKMDQRYVSKQRREFMESCTNKFFQHPVVGYRLIEEESDKHNLDNNSLEPILNHEERLDGSGCPRGIKGDAIDHTTRVVSLADHFDLLMSGELTIQKRSYNQIIKKLITMTDKFDAELLQVLKEEFNYLYEL